MTHSDYYFPEDFWAMKGKLPAARDPNEDRLILSILKDLEFKSVLDIGCGDGRMADLILNYFHDIEKYTGIDLSRDRLMMLEEKKYKNINLHYGDYLKTEFERHDLIIASHVLLHIHPFNIQEFINKMLVEGKIIVHIDYYPTPGKAYDELEFYNFLHNYPSLYPQKHLDKLKTYQYSDRIALFVFKN